MKPSEAIKPISYLKAHASELIKNIGNTHKTFIITQNGEAKAILQDIKKYEMMQDSVALLKILALSNKSLKDKKYKPVSEAFTSIRHRINENDF
ncbi:MAG: type II toxin-antitoxin system Phd/YefM family antitoxin [Candidatus Marinimicrobia bacterium]|nr:type II toxin-antitoxin system Phd/YefM family antitoxin [Candidatus Neomarinimicrobiota bacterium]